MLALAGLAAVASGSANAESMTVDSKGGLEVFTPNDTNYWFKITGRVFVDEGLFDSDEFSSTAFPSGSRIRAARVGVKGGVGGNWVYKLDIDMFDLADNPGRTKFGEAFIGYNACKDLWFALGQVSIPFGLENWANFSEIPFMEVSLASSAFSPDYGIGLYGEWHGDMFTVAGTLYQNPAGSRQYGDVLLVQPGAGLIGGVASGVGPIGSFPGSDTLGIGGRITFSPIHDEFTVYHLGLDARWEDFHENANAFQYVSGMEIRARQTPVLFSNIPVNTVKSNTVWAVEGAGRWGSLILQGEYMWATVNRDGSYFLAPSGTVPDTNPPGGDPRNPGGSFNFNGYYVAVSYVLTGEVKDYDFDSGTFGRVHPCSPWGAWEILARIGSVDLLGSDALSTKPLQFYADPEADLVATGVAPNDMFGSANSFTLGLTWWVNDNVRFLANYVRANLPEDDDIDIFGLRAQVNW